MPVFTLPDSPAITVASPNEAEIDFFGVDLLFDDDLHVTASGDYAQIDGLAALKQAIYLRLITSPGEYAVRPEYGCGVSRWVKKRMARSDLDALRQTIIEQLAKEERIQKVEEVVVENLTSSSTTGVSILVRVTALGKENSFAFTTFAE